MDDIVTGETRKPGPRSELSQGISPLGGFLRTHDRDRYQTALFAPAAPRDGLFALYAFNNEIARVREVVTQPVLGQIRLQWWREVIEAAYAHAAPRQHEIARPLATMIRNYSPSRRHFDRLIDTRERDLADQPPASLAMLEDYAEGSSAPLLYIALEVLGAAEPAALSAAREVGIGYALAGLLRALPFHVRAGRSYIPTDVALHAGLDNQDHAAWRGHKGLRGAVAEIATAASARLVAARHNTAAVPRRALPALLPAVIAGAFLRRLERAGFDPFSSELAARDPLQSWRLAAAIFRRRY